MQTDALAEATEGAGVDDEQEGAVLDMDLGTKGKKKKKKKVGCLCACCQAFVGAAAGPPSVH